MNALEAFWVLLHMQLTSMRWFWRSLLFGGFFVPLWALVFWKFIGGPYTRPGDLAYILAGNVVISLLFGNMGRVANRFAFLKDSGALDYYATLLVKRPALVLAVVVAFLIMALPGLLAALTVGTVWLGVPIRPHLLLLPLALILGSISLSVLGALVGVYGRTPEAASLTINVLTLGLTVLSPVLIPLDRLPPLLQYTSRLLPTTYAAEAVRSALVSQIDGRFWLDLAILAAFCILALVLVNRRLDWRT